MELFRPGIGSATAGSDHICGFVAGAKSHAVEEGLCFRRSDNRENHLLSLNLRRYLAAPPNVGWPAYDNYSPQTSPVADDRDRDPRRALRLLL
jgi:hypothetical protein